MSKSSKKLGAAASTSITLKATSLRKAIAAFKHREHKYILVDKIPVPEPDVLKWGEWFEDFDNRRVAETVIGNFRISTVFLGIDSGFREVPVLFETMVFSSKTGKASKNWATLRAATWQEAEDMHKQMTDQIRGLPVHRYRNYLGL